MIFWPALWNKLIGVPIMMEPIRFFRVHSCGDLEG
ncbi:hypothetical protein SAMN05428979_3017 [Stappia sp. ES.058]|nr:hypothetical protein SAMN05428979_3017 [Stappia sp. ES.058]